MKQAYKNAMAVKTYIRLAEPVEEKLYRLALLGTGSAARASQIASDALVEVYVRMTEVLPEKTDLKSWIWQTGVDETLRLLRNERGVSTPNFPCAQHAS